MIRKIPFSNSYFLLLIVAVLATSCTYRRYGETIPSKKFVNVLVDVHLADGIAVNIMSGTNMGPRMDSASLYNSVFDKYGVTRAMFDSTMSYYTEHPDDFQKIYNKVTAKLKRLEDELNAKQNEEQKKLDEEQKKLEEQKKKTHVVDTVLKKK